MNILEQKIFNLANPVALDMEYSIVDVNAFGKEKIILQIFLEKKDFSSVSINDCAKFSRAFSVILDINNLIEKKYILEVSSAGVNRKISKLEDFERFIGNDVIVKTKLPIEGQKSFKGILTNIIDNKIGLSTDNNEIFIPLEFIDKANLDLLKNILNTSDLSKNNKHKKGNKEGKNAK